MKINIVCLYQMYHNDSILMWSRAQAWLLAIGGVLVDVNLCILMIFVSNNVRKTQILRLIKPLNMTYGVKITKTLHISAHSHCLTKIFPFLFYCFSFTVSTHLCLFHPSLQVTVCRSQLSQIFLSSTQSQPVGTKICCVRDFRYLLQWHHRYHT